MELEFAKLEFWPKIQTIVAFFFSGVCQKRHYRYPIVAFSINAAIGTKKKATIVFAFQRLKKKKRLAIPAFLRNATIG